jgi:hypothetical protein
MGYFERREQVYPNITLLSSGQYLHQELYVPSRRGFDTKCCLIELLTIHCAKSYVVNTMSLVIKFDANLCLIGPWKTAILICPGRKCLMSALVLDRKVT